MEVGVGRTVGVERRLRGGGLQLALGPCLPGAPIQSALVPGRGAEPMSARERREEREGNSETKEKEVNRHRGLVERGG